MSEWLNLKGFFGHPHFGPCSPFKPCNHNLYTGIMTMHDREGWKPLIIMMSTLSSLASGCCHENRRCHHRLLQTLAILLKPPSVNTLKQRQKCHHFGDDISKCIFLNENLWISLQISLKFVRKVQIINIPALVHIMAWHRPDNKSLPEPMMVTLLM